MHQRLQNELAFRLSREALKIIGRNLPEDERRQKFDTLYRTFKEEVLRFEKEKASMEARLRGSPASKDSAPSSNCDSANSNDV